MLLVLSRSGALGQIVWQARLAVAKGDDMFRNVWPLIKDTANDWLDDEAPRLAASLAFYTLLSLAPLIVITVAIAGLALGPEAAKGQIAGELGAIVGSDAAKGVETVVANAKAPASGTLATVLGVLALCVGATGVFGELQYSLNRIWEVKAKPGRGIWGEVKDRFFSFTMVLGVAFLLLVSLVLSAALSAIGRSFANALPGGELVWQVVNFVFSFALITGLFALIYKVVPDAEIRWPDVWPGALVTALLFTLGKSLLGIYLGKASVGSAYGAAGSLVVLVVWVYYSAQILFLGAEFTQVYARRRGSEIKPTGKGIPLREDDARPHHDSAAHHA
jgi:membrane protein